jgi:hypothetical protein
VAIWLAAVMLIASVALFVAAPLAELIGAPAVRRAEESEDTRLEHQRGLATAAIRELDFDHAMGKLEDAEYCILRDRLEARALAAMEGLARLGRASSSEPSQCSQCGAPRGGQPFCGRCGAASPAAVASAGA